MYDNATYGQEKDNTLDFEDLIRILNSIEAFEAKWGARIARFSITGGDPLQRPDWKEFVAELHQRQRRFSLMGNPETLTEENVEYLAKLGIVSFQMSLDGMESTHDEFRSKGSFHHTIEKLGLLKDYAIHTNIMFTLFPTNAKELIPLMRYLAENTEASSFSFDIGCFVGNASKIEQNFSPKYIKQIYMDFITEKQRLHAAGWPMQIAEKSNLLKLTRFESGKYYPISPKKRPPISGCLIGWKSVAILSDGTMLACRRLPLEVGKMPEQSFEEVFLGSLLMKKFRRPQFYKGCGSCDFFNVCRGCPANVYSMVGDPFAKNPLCFRDMVSRQTEESKITLPGAPINADFEQEFQLIAASHFPTSLLREEFLEDFNLRRVFLDVSNSIEERRKFLDDPRDYLSSCDIKLNEDQATFLLNQLCQNQMIKQKEIPSVNSFSSMIFDRMLGDIFDAEGSLERRLDELLNTTIPILVHTLEYMLQKSIETARSNEVAVILLELGFDKNSLLIQRALKRAIDDILQRGWIGVVESVHALRFLTNFSQCKSQINKGIARLYTCQNENGGIGRFHGDISRIPLCFYTLEAFRSCGVSKNEQVVKMIRWMEQEWTKDAKMGGLTYKCGFVLLANACYPGDFNSAFVASSLEWLLRHQLANGSWSAYERAPVGSDPTYTAIALRALIKYRRFFNLKDTIERGFEWLLDNQSNGIWTAHPFEIPVIECSRAIENYLRVSNQSSF